MGRELRGTMPASRGWVCSTSKLMSKLLIGAMCLHYVVGMPFQAELMADVSSPGEGADEAHPDDETPPDEGADDHPGPVFGGGPRPVVTPEPLVTPLPALPVDGSEDPAAMPVLSSGSLDPTAQPSKTPTLHPTTHHPTLLPSGHPSRTPTFKPKIPVELRKAPPKGHLCYAESEMKTWEQLKADQAADLNAKVNSAWKYNGAEPYCPVYIVPNKAYQLPCLASLPSKDVSIKGGTMTWKYSGKQYQIGPQSGAELLGWADKQNGQNRMLKFKLNTTYWESSES